jgi:hypothetical protein
MMVKEGDRVGSFKGTPYPKLHTLHKATAGVPAAEDVLCCTQVSSTVIRPIVLSSSSDSSICFSIKGLGLNPYQASEWNVDCDYWIWFLISTMLVEDAGFRLEPLSSFRMRFGLWLLDMIPNLHDVGRGCRV